MGFFSSIKENLSKFTFIVKPLFNLKENKRKLAVLGCYMALPVIEFYTTKFLAKGISETEEDNISWTNKVYVMAGSMVVGVVLVSLRASISQYLSGELENSLRKELMAEWLNNNTAIGIDVIRTVEKSMAATKKAKDTKEQSEITTNAKTPVHEILNRHVSSFSNGAINVTLTTVNGTISIVLNVCTLRNLTKDTRLLALSSLYGLVCASWLYLNNQSGLVLRKEGDKIDEAMNSRCIHVEQNQDQILSLNAEALELRIGLDSLNSKAIFNRRQLVRTIKSYFSGHLTFDSFTNLIDIIGPMLVKEGLINSVALVLVKHQSYKLTYTIQDVMYGYNNHFAPMMLGMEEIINFKNLIQGWKKLRKDLPFKQTYSNPNFTIRGLNIHIPSDSTISDHVRATLTNPNLIKDKTKTSRAPKALTFQFELGKTYRFEGASNAGKTTTIKALMGLWPFATGEINYPCERDQIRFVSQKTFIPLDSTLLEVITYPKELCKNSLSALDNISCYLLPHIVELCISYLCEDPKLKPSTRKVGQIKEMMHAFNLQHKVGDLYKKENWQEILSQGEKQRLAIIGALQSDPKVLVMDEAAAGIDKDNKRIIERYIKKCLPRATIIYTDHYPLDDPNYRQPVNLSDRKDADDHIAGVAEPFADHAIYIDKDKRMLKLKHPLRSG